MSSIIVLFVGRRGSGKTLSMVHFDLEMAAREVQARGERKPVVANLHLNYDHAKLQFPRAEKGSEMPWFRLFDARILLDEGHVVLDSRTAMSVKNRLASYFVTQTRKRRIDLLATTQTFGQIDVRLRNMTDYVIYCSFHKTSKGRFVRQEIYRTPILLGMPPAMVRLLPAEPLFEKYDTNELILPEE